MKRGPTGPVPPLDGPAPPLGWPALPDAPPIAEPALPAEPRLPPAPALAGVPPFPDPALPSERPAEELPAAPFDSRPPAPAPAPAVCTGPMESPEQALSATPAINSVSSSIVKPVRIVDDPLTGRRSSHGSAGTR